MSIPEGERRIAIEAAMQELGELQLVARRFVPLRLDAEALLTALIDFGARLRQAARRGPLGESAADEIAGEIVDIRDEWRDKLQTLRTSAVYTRAVAAYEAQDPDALAVAIPALLAEVELAEPAAALYHPFSVATHRRDASHFRTPEASADLILERVRSGLSARPPSPDWWDTDLPSIDFVDDPAAADGPIALLVRGLPSGVPAFREGESWRVFAPRLVIPIAVVIAESSDDAWWEASADSYESYRTLLIEALGARGIETVVTPTWA